MRSRSFYIDGLNAVGACGLFLLTTSGVVLFATFWVDPLIDQYQRLLARPEIMTASGVVRVSETTWTRLLLADRMFAAGFIGIALALGLLFIQRLRCAHSLRHPQFERLLYSAGAWMGLVWLLITISIPIRLIHHALTR